MAFWGIRAGRHGENEEHALDRKVITIGWEGVGDLSDISSRDALAERMAQTYPSCAPSTLSVWTGEVWAFRSKMQPGEIVALPLKTRSAIALGKITGPYQFDPDGPPDGKHQRAVKWLRTDVPRGEFPLRILRSLGSTLTVFQVSRDNAEAWVLAYLKGTLEDPSAAPVQEAADNEADNIEDLARDQIRKHVTARFREHAFAELIAEILTAQGYRVLKSPPGPDGGIDILAGSGPMGFDAPRLAVQVKSGKGPVDVKVLRELQGSMGSFGATQGLLVSWGGFKGSVYKEARRLFFQVRLWDADDVLAALEATYERLPAGIQAEVPLKRVWALVEDEMP